MYVAGILLPSAYNEAIVLLNRSTKLSRRPNLSPAAVKKRLQKTTRFLKGFTRNDQGSGLLQSGNAVL
jgi:hypothetical protein